MGKITINQEALKTSRQWTRHKVKDGSNIYRILPPFGDVEVHNNYPYRKWNVVWLTDPASGKRRPFASPFTDGADKCPIHEFQLALKTFIDKKRQALQANGIPEDKIREHLGGLYEAQWNIRLQKLYAYNASDKSGNVGLLELKSTAHKKLKKRMNEYISKYAQDPTSLNSDVKDDAGVWFNFKREGSGKETTYDVEFNESSYRDESGEIITKIDRSPLPQNVVDNFNELAYDLNSIYVRKSYEELYEILLYNLKLLSKDTPLLASIPGFDVSGLDEVSITSQQKQEVREEPAQKAEIKPNVSLNLGDEPNESPVEKKEAAESAPLTNDNIDDFINSILEN